MMFVAHGKETCDEGVRLHDNDICTKKLDK